MKVMWQIDDGYAGKSRPHTVEIPDEELQECETDDEKQLLIDEYVQQDFNNTVSWYIISSEE